MEIVYRAFDGKEFETEEDCAYYESVADVEQFRHRIKTLDADGNQCDIVDADRHFVVYIDEADSDAFKKYLALCANAGAEAPPQAGLWLFDEDIQEWVSWVDEMDKASKRVIELENLFQKMKG